MIFISIVLALVKTYRPLKVTSTFFQLQIEYFIQLSISAAWKVETLENGRIFLHFDSVRLFVVSHKRQANPFIIQLIPSSNEFHFSAHCQIVYRPNEFLFFFALPPSILAQNILSFRKCNNIAIFHYFDKIWLFLFLLLLSRLHFARTLVSIRLALGVIYFIVHRNNTIRHFERCPRKRWKETEHVENTDFGT